MAVYFATTIASARKMVWDTPDGIPSIIQDLGIEASLNESDHRVTFANGSVLWVAGCETLPDARRWKGLRYDVAVCDEAQDWDDVVLRYMVHEALGWALMDRRGELLLTGTPGAYFGGLFYEVATGVRSGWKSQHWTSYENPHITDPGAYIQQECRDRGLELDDPIVQREFFGRWVRDTNNMLFHYQPGRNDFTELPQAQGWRYVLGVDIGGTIDLTTYNLAAFRPNDRTVYFLNNYGERATEETAPLTRMAAIVETYQRKLPGLMVAADFGALGVNFQLELRNRMGVSMDKSAKSDKPGTIRLMNDQFRLGLVKLGPNCQQLRHQLMTLVRDPKTQIERPQDDCDYADAALYAWRRCWAYVAKPVEDTSATAERERMVQRIIGQRLRANRPPEEEIPQMGSYSDQL